MMILSHAEPFRDPTLLAPELGQPQIPRNQLVTSGSSALPGASQSRGVRALLELCSGSQGTGIQFPPPPGWQSWEAWNKAGSVCSTAWDLQPHPFPPSLLDIKVTKPLSSVTGVPRIVEAEEAPGLTYGLREAVSRPAGPGLATRTNLHCYLPPWEGWSGAIQPPGRGGSSMIHKLSRAPRF